MRESPGHGWLLMVLGWLVACGDADQGAASASTGAGSGGSSGQTGQGTTATGKDGWGSPITDAYPSPVTDVSSCIAITAPEAAWGWGLYGYWTGEGLATWLGPEVFPPHDQPSFLVLKLLEGERGWYSDPADIAPGTFLYGPSSGAQASIATCTVCPVLHTDVWGDNPTAVWYPVAGSLTIEQASAATREYVGKFQGMIFRRIGIHGVASYGGWVTDPDPIHPDQPPCAYLAEARFDTRRLEGRPCHASADCPNGRYHVCDAATATCVRSQCDQGKAWDGEKGDWIPTDSACPSGQVCEIESDLETWYYGTHIEHALTTGRCLIPCDDSSTKCPAGLACQPSDAVVDGAAKAVCRPL